MDTDLLKQLNDLVGLQYLVTSSHVASRVFYVMLGLMKQSLHEYVAARSTRLSS